MKKDVVETGNWTVKRRQQLGWSREDLASKVDDMAHDFRWSGIMPTLDDIAALEDHAPSEVPRWFKLIRYAVDRAKHPDSEALAWLSERNYYYSRDVLRMARPLLFEDECRFIDRLNSLDERHRKAIRAFVTAWSGPYIRRPQEREKTVAEFLRKLEVL